MIPVICVYTWANIQLFTSQPCMAIDSGLHQIGLRLQRDQLERLDAYCQRVSMDRTSVIRMAINQLLEGSVSSPVGSEVHSVDQPARDALEALLGRVEDVEEDLRVLKQAKQAAKEVDESFAGQFLKPQ